MTVWDELAAATISGHSMHVFFADDDIVIVPGDSESFEIKGGISTKEVTWALDQWPSSKYLETGSAQETVTVLETSHGEGIRKGYGIQKGEDSWVVDQSPFVKDGWYTFILRAE